MSPVPHHSLASVLTLSPESADTDALLAAASAVLTPLSTVCIPPSARVGLGIAFALLEDFSVEVDLHGLLGVMDRELGRAYEDLLASCELIGAQQAQDYLEGLRASLPAGAMPSDKQARAQLGLQLDQDGVFDALDARYRQAALKEISQRAHAFLHRHRQTIEAALARADDPDAHVAATTAAPATSTLAPPSASPSSAVPSQIALRTRRKVLATRRARADERGVRIPDGTEDPRMSAFVDRVSGLTPPEWQPVLADLAREAAAHETARGTLASVAVELATGRLLDARARDLLMRPALAARDRLLHATGVAALPGDAKAQANALLVTAWQALLLYDWLVVEPASLDAIQVVLWPFRNVAPLPPDLPPRPTAAA